MKYIITDKGEVRVCSIHRLHSSMLEDCKGKVVSAGYFCKGAGGAVEDIGRIHVFGESIGFGIKAKPEDAKILEEANV